MTDMTDDYDDLRNEWKKLTLRVEHLEHELDIEHRSARDRRFAGSRGRLSRILKFESVMGTVCAFLIPVMLYGISGSVFLPVCAAVFFLVLSVNLIRIDRAVTSIDCSRMSVSQSLKGICGVELMLHRHTLMGVGMALPLLLWIFYEFSHRSDAMLAGGCAGLVIGTVVGLRVRMRMKRIMADMREDVGTENDVI